MLVGIRPGDQYAVGSESRYAAGVRPRDKAPENSTERYIYRAATSSAMPDAGDWGSSERSRLLCDGRVDTERGDGPAVQARPSEQTRPTWVSGWLMAVFVLRGQRRVLLEY